MPEPLASLGLTPAELAQLPPERLRVHLKHATEHKDYAEAIRLSGILNARGDDAIEQCRVAMNRVWVQ